MEARTLTRQQLHELVWQTPMQRLGDRFSLSGNGLAKICRRLGVPYPPRGWWAKKAAGKPVVITPLSAAAPGSPVQVSITPTPPETYALKEQVRARAAEIGQIAVRHG